VSNLKIRRIPFTFDGVDFIWNPHNPAFSIMMNKVSFFAIALEKYFCQAIREADSQIRNPAVREEARLFMIQESAHALAHRTHVRALIERYPGLQEASDAMTAHFDKLYAEKDLAYHLGYAGGLESIFTPSFKLLIDHRELLFAKGDSRVASLFIWHFCEEIEHRSSALMIYDEVVGSYWYRIKNFPSYMRHVTDALQLLEQKFKQHLPGIPDEWYSEKFDAALPLRARLKAFAGIVRAQMPGSDPVNQTVPDYYAEWLQLENSGADLTKVVGVIPQEAA
jgi:predicted metal-dependent hydrolase